MMNETVNAGMEIKNENNEPVFENQYVEQPTQPKGVFLRRTPEGLIRDDQNGKEISSIFDIIEVGDNINHQEVVKVDDNSVTLDYFGKRSVLTDEREIFSVLIKEEIAKWKQDISQLDWTKLFNNMDTPNVFRLLELICMSVDMENIQYIASVNDENAIPYITGAVATTLRKPIILGVDDLKDKNVVLLIGDYNKEAIKAAKDNIEPLNGKVAYTIAITNNSGVEVDDKDIIVLC